MILSSNRIKKSLYEFKDYKNLQTIQAFKLFCIIQKIINLFLFGNIQELSLQEK